MMEGEGRGKRLAATACAFTLLFCLAVGLGVHGAFQYQQVKQEQRLSAEYSLKQAQKAAARPPQPAGNGKKHRHTGGEAANGNTGE